MHCGMHQPCKVHIAAGIAPSRQLYLKLKIKLHTAVSLSIIQCFFQLSTIQLATLALTKWLWSTVQSMSASNFFHTALPAIFSMFWLLLLCLLFFIMAVLKWALHGEEIVHVHHLLQFVRREMVHCQGTVAALESGYIQGSNTCSCTSVHVLCVANNPKHPH